MIGVGILRKNYPLYYDGVNEKGLAMAGLNFPGYARYRPPRERMDNIAPFELIPWDSRGSGVPMSMRQWGRCDI